jgi:hypothetical protein
MPTRPNERWSPNLEIVNGKRFPRAREIARQTHP